MWLEEDISSLSEIVARYKKPGSIDWAKVVLELQGRYTLVQCKNKWKKLREMQRGAPWSKEDRELLAYLRHEDPRLSWEALRLHLRGKTAHQCEMEWKRMQGVADKKRMRWTEEEVTALNRLGPLKCSAEIGRSLDSCRRQYLRMKKTSPQQANDIDDRMEEEEMST